MCRLKMIRLNNKKSIWKDISTYNIIALSTLAFKILIVHIWQPMMIGTSCKIFDNYNEMLHNDMMLINYCFVAHKINVRYWNTIILFLTSVCCCFGHGIIKSQLSLPIPNNHVFIFLPKIGYQ